MAITHAPARLSISGLGWGFSAALVVLFVLFPGIVWTGLAMSFAVTSVFPFLVTLLGGHQSARTLHFVFASLLLIFFIVHMAMLVLVGFRSHVQAMITGRVPGGRSTK